MFKIFDYILFFHYHFDFYFLVIKEFDSIWIAFH